MTRQTSIDVYNQIQEEGLLGRIQWLVYSLLYEKGPLTQGEIAQKLNMDRNVASPRFAELLEKGSIAIVGERACGVTGRICTLWDVTSNLPTKLEKKPTKNEVIKRQAERIQFLESQVKEYQDKLRRLRDGELF